MSAISAPPLPPGLEVYRPPTLLGTAILVVDDEAAMQAQLGDDLKALGYRPVGARTASEARRAFEAERFGGVLLDIALESADEAGYELLAWFRERTPSLPVVVLSATQINSAAIRRAYELGASSYFVKGNSPLAHIYSDLAARMLEVGTARNSSYRVGAAGFDATARTLEVGGRKVSLTAQQAAVVAYLARAARAVPTAELIEAGLFRQGATPATVHTACLALRRRIDLIQDGLGARFLRSSPHGYSLEVVPPSGGRT